MNFTNADTLARIVKMRRSEKHERGEFFVYIQTRQTNPVDTPQADNLPNISSNFTQAIYR